MSLTWTCGNCAADGHEGVGSPRCPDCGSSLLGLGLEGLEISIDRSDVDNTLVIFIDTEGVDEDGDGPKCRIYLNDHPLHENPPYPMKEISRRERS